MESERRRDQFHVAESCVDAKPVFLVDACMSRDESTGEVPGLRRLFGDGEKTVPEVQGYEDAPDPLSQM